MIASTLLLSVLAGADNPLAVIRFDPAVDLKGDEKSSEHVYYTSASDKEVQAGVWEAAPYTSGPHKTTYSEFMYLL
jgi:uncharacterized cupin superfamily protein